MRAVPRVGVMGRYVALAAVLLSRKMSTKAVQKATLQGGLLKFAGTVNFVPKLALVPSKTGFPPTKVALRSVAKVCSTACLPTITSRRP